MKKKFPQSFKVPEIQRTLPIAIFGDQTSRMHGVGTGMSGCPHWCSYRKQSQFQDAT